MSIILNKDNIEPYFIYMIEDENGEELYGDDPQSLVFSCIKRNLDCKLYKTKLDEPIGEFLNNWEENKLNKLKEIDDWEYIESYHA